jgi:hypothetical protein
LVLGHLTVTAAVHREVRRVWPSLPVALGALLLGAYLPDILDKPIGMITGLSGRGYGHSLVVQVPVFAAAFLLLPRHRATVRTLALGAVIHLIEDRVELRVLLAPLLGPIPFVPPTSLFGNVLRYYTTSSVLVWLEAAALAYWAAVGVAVQIRRRRRLSSPPAIAV